MNRENKYRGFSIELNKWLFGFFMIGLNGESYIIHKVKVDENTTILEYTIVAPESVGQFAGLPDKKGVDAYENDLAKHPSAKHLFEIVFYKGAFWLQSQEPSLLKNNIKTNISHLEFCEIIGNSFTNPELINK